MVVEGLSDLVVGGTLGECYGGAGIVFVARRKGSPSQSSALALRRIHLDKDGHNGALLQHEILTTRQLQHPNILPYYSSFVNGLYLYIVTPLMSLGSCKDLINRYFNEGLPEQACTIILRDTLQGLNYIHEKGFIHRGIRSSHVLVCSSGKVCLSGLRSAASLLVRGKRQKSLHHLPLPESDNTSLLWLSPEVLEQNLRGYNEKSDIYSIGMLACTLANGAIPFSNIPTTLMLTEKVRGNVPQLLDCTTFNDVLNVDNYQGGSEMNDQSNSGSNMGSAQRIAHAYYTRSFHNTFHQFTTMCLQREPNDRPTCSQLLNHSLFKQIKSDSLAHILYETKPLEENKDSISGMMLEEQMNELDLAKPCDWDF